MSLTASQPTAMYPCEPKTYVSTTTIKLKPSTLHSTKVANGNTMVFEFHTDVTVPPNTPVVKQPVVEESIESTTQAENLQTALPMRTNDLFLPAYTYDEKDDLKTHLDKFMTCERYHSQYHQTYQQGTHL